MTGCLVPSQNLIASAPLEPRRLFWCYARSHGKRHGGTGETPYVHHLSHTRHLAGSNESTFRHRNAFLRAALQRHGRAALLDRCEAYRHFAAQCLELAQLMEAPHDRSVLLEMALLWSRLAELAAHSATAKDSINRT